MAKRRTQTPPRARKDEKTVVFNRWILLYAIVSLAVLSFSISLLCEGVTDLGIPLLGVFLFFVVGIFFTPIVFVFTSKGITTKWLLGQRRVIPWSGIQSVIEYRWGEACRDLPKYTIIYLVSYKGQTISKDFDLPRNKQTKRLMERHAKHRIL